MTHLILAQFFKLRQLQVPISLPGRPHLGLKSIFPHLLFLKFLNPFLELVLVLLITAVSLEFKWHLGLARHLPLRVKPENFLFSQKLLLFFASLEFSQFEMAIKTSDFDVLARQGHVSIDLGFECALFDLFVFGATAFFGDALLL